MLQEKPNNNNIWKKDLEQLSELPGGAFDKASSWEKLHARLESKTSRRIGAAWYWVAASILFIPAFIWIYNNRKQETIADTKPLEQQDETARPEGLNSTKAGTVQLVQEEQPVQPKKSSVGSSKQTEMENTNITNNKSSIVRIPSMPDSAKTGHIPGMIIKETITPDTLLAVVTDGTQPKKTLRVVHINQLDKPVEDNQRIAHMQRNVLIHGQVNNGTFIQSYTPGDNILKIKLSPNN